MKKAKFAFTALLIGLMIILPAGEAAKGSGGSPILMKSSSGGSPVMMKGNPGGSSPIVMKSDNQGNGQEKDENQDKQDVKKDEQEDKQVKVDDTDKPVIENLGQEIKDIMMDRKIEWKMTIGDLRETGYKGPVSEYVKVLNEQAKMLKDEVMNKIIDNNMTHTVTDVLTKRLDAKYREQAAKQRRITQEEKAMAFEQIDPEAAEIIEGFDPGFQDLVYINLMEDDQELIEDITILDEGFEIDLDLDPEDLEGLDEQEILEKITRGGNNEEET